MSQQSQDVTSGQLHIPTRCIIGAVAVTENIAVRPGPRRGLTGRHRAAAPVSINAVSQRRGVVVTPSILQLVGDQRAS